MISANIAHVDVVLLHQLVRPHPYTFYDPFRELISSIGTPHRVSQDDEYNGYLIPAGSTIMANQWCRYLPARIGRALI